MQVLFTRVLEETMRQFNGVYPVGSPEHALQRLMTPYTEYLSLVWGAEEEKAELDALFDVTLMCTTPHQDILPRLFTPPEGETLSIVEDMKASHASSLVVVSGYWINPRARTFIKSQSPLPEGACEDMTFSVAARLVDIHRKGGVLVRILLIGGDGTEKDYARYGEYPASAVEFYMREEWESRKFKPEDLYRRLTKDSFPVEFEQQALLIAHHVSVHEIDTVFVVTSHDCMCFFLAMIADALDREGVLSITKLVPVPVGFWDDCTWCDMQGTADARRFTMGRRSFGPNTPQVTHPGQRFKETPYAEFWSRYAGWSGSRWRERVDVRAERTRLEAKARAGGWDNSHVEELRHHNHRLGALSPRELRELLLSQKNSWILNVR
jgi:hypothetical protein